MRQLDVLREVKFGSQVAEEEVQQLQNYFVETHQWNQIATGDLDIIRGEKGAGKSAIYSLLSTRSEDFFSQGILLVAAENPRGTTVFRDLISSPPASEEEFKWLWKVYLVTLIAEKMRSQNIDTPEARKVYAALEESKLLEAELNLAGLLRAAHRFVKHIMRLEVQAGLELDQATLQPSGYIGRISFKEPSHDLKELGFHSIDTLFRYADKALGESRSQVWLLLDRLDVAFAEDHSLEANALRALLRVYNDLGAFRNVSLKIFLREDIWKRIFEGGFREASHINNYAVLDWSENSLSNLTIRRLLNNEAILAYYDLKKDEVLASGDLQQSLFEQLFPDQVEQGNNPKTFKWMVSRCADATGKTAPREIIHLLKSLQEKEIQRLERGGTPAPQKQLFDRSVFKLALEPVSHARLHQYLYAEYAEQRPFISALDRQKTEQTAESLTSIWGLPIIDSVRKAEELIALGFFERRGSREKPTFWVPFLYRDALRMSQGRADE